MDEVTSICIENDVLIQSGIKDKPVNDGTQREAHSVTGDSAILNPYQEETQDPPPSRKNGKAGKVSPQRSIKVKQSKGIKSAPTPKKIQRSSSRKRQTQIEVRRLELKIK